MDQPNVVMVLCDTPRYRVEDGAREIAEAIRSGKLDPSDPRGITVSWYKGLIAQGVMV